MFSRRKIWVISLGVEHLPDLNFHGAAYHGLEARRALLPIGDSCGIGEVIWEALEDWA